MKRCFVAVFVAVIISGVMSVSARRVEINLLQTSDVHGNYFPYNFITGKNAAGSLARVSSAVKDARKKYGDNVILLDNGDILQGQPTVYYYNYVDTVKPHVASEVMNYLRYDAGNVGNHDVETGRDVLDRWSKDCDMPILGANIIDESTGEPYFKPYEVIEHDGVKVAVLGMITPAIPAWLPETLWKGLRFDDIETTAKKWMPIIIDKEAPDVVVGLFHAGQAGNVLAGYKENPSLEVAKNVPGFDIILMGHDHRRECNKVMNVDGDSVLIMNPANNSVVLTDINMTFEVDDADKVVSKRIDGRLRPMSDFDIDAEFIVNFSPYIAEVNNYVNESVGHLTDSISTRDAYFGPSAFVDLIHKLQLDITGADISFAAPISYDANIPAGDIFIGEMFNLYKYENMLYVMELTGKEIKDYLEFSYGLWANTMKSGKDHLLLFKDNPTDGDESRAMLANPSYNFDSAAGIIYEVDVRKRPGHRVKIISMADGSRFDSSKIYKVALNSYRGNGGGELLTRGAGIPHDKLSSRIIYSTDRDLRYYLADYIHKKEVVKPEKLNQWRFVPEKYVIPAAKRDYLILFPEK